MKIKAARERADQRAAEFNEQWRVVIVQKPYPHLLIQRAIGKPTGNIIYITAPGSGTNVHIHVGEEDNE